MAINQAPFNEYQKIARNIAEQEGIIADAQSALTVEKKNLKTLIEKYYLTDLTKEEELFLKLNIVCNGLSVKKTVFDAIIEKCSAEMSQIPDEASIIVNPMRVQITNTELNQNGFAYDTGRPTIRSAAMFLLQKLHIFISSHEFDYKNKYVYEFKTLKAEL